ncbi:MAG: hypothetical protein IKG15_10220 [Solobacterium sp.]|nr:hypothetical protein [Solobacterium sp.]
MYLNRLVKIPDVPGKITLRKKGSTVYVSYEYARDYSPERKFNIPKRVMIGKQSKSALDMMQPNENYLKYFSGTDLLDESLSADRSSCLRIGSCILFEHIMHESGISELLRQQVGAADLALLMDLVAYTLICENSAGQHFSDYAYQHPSAGREMHVYSDQEIAVFLKSLREKGAEESLKLWNKSRDHTVPVCIFFGTSMRDQESGDNEPGFPGEERRKAVSYAIAYDASNSDPLFPIMFPGGTGEHTRVETAVRTAEEYGYRNITCVFDRGFGKDNILDAVENGYQILIRSGSSHPRAEEIILKQKGTFERNRRNIVSSYDLHGITVRDHMYEDPERELSYHVFYSPRVRRRDEEEVKIRIRRISTYLKSKCGHAYSPGLWDTKYFDLTIDEHGILQGFSMKKDAVNKELGLCGYFMIITSENMAARDAFSLYTIRDETEKLFHGDRNYLDPFSNEYRNESSAGKSFVEFVALVVRSRIYRRILENRENTDSVLKHMTVSGILKELERIELIRGQDGIYGHDQIISGRQNAILKAFGISAEQFRDRTLHISEQLEKSSPYRV